MNWRLSENVSLVNDRIKPEVARRQQRTAAEILERFDEQPGVILADEVGMGKTYVALAVAVSVIEATDYKRSVVVMVPPSVQTKWPREWDVFREECYSTTTSVRATSHSVNKGSDFLKLLDDPTHRRQHLIFMTHGALTSSLADPLVKLAIVRRAFLRRSSLAKQRRAFPRWASKVLANRQLRDEQLVRALLETHPREWRGIYEEETGRDLADDPVPEVLLKALDRTDVSDLLEVLRALPLAKSAYLDQRLQEVRSQVNRLLSEVWRRSLRGAHIHLPLLVMDEAHHTKNPYSRVAGLFANPEAREDAELLKGPLGRVFDRMLFLTATPFQLGHRELIEVLRRFEGIRWGGELDRATYVQGLEDLERALNVAQTSAIRLDRAWGRVTETDVLPPDEHEGLPSVSRSNGSTSLRQAFAAAKETEEKMRRAETLLRPWVIRHTREDKDTRRSVHCGRAILDEEASDSGLVVSGPAVLPFLLAARAQGIVAAEGRFAGQRTRAFFAEGLASSFEAYRETRRNTDMDPVADDLPAIAGENLPEEVNWYLKHLDEALPEGSKGVWSHHPKIKATVSRAVSLWEAGEKVLVFCFYRATGRALRNHISRAMESRLLALGAERLRLRQGDDAVRDELARWSERFDDGRVRREALRILGEIFADAPLEKQEKEQSISVCLRFLRTASFLVRFVDLGNPDRVEAVRSAFEHSDGVGISLRDTFQFFARFLASRVEAERTDLLSALDALQTGEIFAASSDAADQGHVVRGERLLPNVRLANGEVDRHTRYRLMLAFNSPFFPEVLVASSVLGEGVDLHLNCRYVIHHDLDWNPSVIEQRTGRLDRLSSKAEVLGAPVTVYEPFLEGTQDEKQFRVMKDRERWFNIVMGERLELDEWSLDRVAQRVPIPKDLADRLMMRLDLRHKRKVRR